MTLNEIWRKYGWRKWLSVMKMATVLNDSKAATDINIFSANVANETNMKIHNAFSNTISPSISESSHSRSILITMARLSARGAINLLAVAQQWQRQQLA